MVRLIDGHQASKEIIPAATRTAAAGAATFATFLAYLIFTLSGGRKQRIQEEDHHRPGVAETHFLDYVDAEGIVQPILTIVPDTRRQGS